MEQSAKRKENIMARTTATEVKAIMDNCTVDDTVVDVFIISANAVVTKVFSGDTVIGSTMKEEIERWFTAHMLASTLCRTTTKEKIGEASVEYTGTFRDNLSSTPYGQVVLTLDLTGKMANIGKKRASIYSVTSFE